MWNFEYISGYFQRHCYVKFCSNSQLTFHNTCSPCKIRHKPDLQEFIVNFHGKIHWEFHGHFMILSGTTAFLQKPLLILKLKFLLIS